MPPSAGIQDITTQVDFTSVRRAGQAAGLTAVGNVPQGLFLQRLGLQTIRRNCGPARQGRQRLDHTARWPRRPSARHLAGRLPAATRRWIRLARQPYPPGATRGHRRFPRPAPIQGPRPRARRRVPVLARWRTRHARLHPLVSGRHDPARIAYTRTRTHPAHPVARCYNRRHPKRPRFSGSHSYWICPMPGPLHGINVVEFSTMIATPTAGYAPCRHGCQRHQGRAALGRPLALRPRPSCPPTAVPSWPTTAASAP